MAKTDFVCLLCAAIGLIVFSAPPAQADTYVFEQIIEEAEAEAEPQQTKDGSPAGRRIKENAPMIWKTPVTSKLTVRTGPSAMALESGGDLTIYDFAKKRIYTLDKNEHVYEDRSLYALVAFKVAELGNRYVLGQFLSKVGVGDKSFDDFYSETMLGVTVPQQGSGYKLDSSNISDVLTYKYSSAPVTRFMAAEPPLTAAALKELSKFYLYGCLIHPLIREDIEQTGKAPKELMYYVENGTFTKRRVSLKLQSHNSEVYRLELPSDYKHRTATKDDPLGPVRLKLRQLGEKPAADAKEKTVADFNRFIVKEKYLDAKLTLAEWFLQAGENLGGLMTPVLYKVKLDSEVAAFDEGMEAPTSEQSARDALSALDRVDKKRLEKGYLIDIFRANLIEQMRMRSVKDIKTTGEPMPEKAFLNALSVNPYLTGAYHDLGRCFQNAFQHPLAWDCYDMARKLYPNHPLMNDVDQQEAALEKRLPQYF